MAEINDTKLIALLRELAGPRYPDDICGKTLMALAADALARLQAENERKDAALREIVDCNMAEPWRLTARLMQDIARAALIPSPSADKETA